MFQDTADLVICEKKQKPIVENDGRFILKTVIVSEGMDTDMFIYAKSQVDWSVTETDRFKLNQAYDREYHPLVSLK